MRPPLLALALVAAACSGGSDSSTTARDTGAVQVLVDTATGTDAMVQFQVVGVTLETRDGSSTGNLLAAPQLLTLADPTGDVDGLRLTSVASGEYTTLHLGIAPGSGFACYADGAQVTVSTDFDLAIPLPGELRHDAQRNSWLVVGHDGSAPPANATAGFRWSPRMSGRVSGAAVVVPDLDLAIVESDRITALVPDLGDAPLYVSFAENCSFVDERGDSIADRAAFLASSHQGDELTIDGLLAADGDFGARHVRRRGRGQNHQEPRLIGRIESIEASTTSFVMNVFAEARRGGPRTIRRPERARVFAENAHIVGSRARTLLEFADLAVGQLVKVEWTRRAVVANGPDELLASVIEVAPAGGAGMNPQWHGSVAAVDLALRTLTVVPQNGDPIVVQGQPADPVTVHVDVGVPIVRDVGSPLQRLPIRIDDIAAGQDRVWFGGEVTGPAEIEANQVRVRLDR
jgi:hypothetical protein